MRKGMTIAACTMLACMGVAAEAEARSWSRGGSVTGPRGTTTWQRSGDCAGGTCTRSRTVTGPNGGTWERHRGGTW